MAVSTHNHILTTSNLQSDPKNSLNLTDFGTNGDPKQAIPFLPNETTLDTMLRKYNNSRVIS